MPYIRQVGAILRNTASTSVAPTISNVLVGNTLVACVFYELSGTLGTYSGVAPWQAAVQEDVSGASAEIWYLNGINNGGGTFSPLFNISSAAGKCSGFVFEMEGADPYTPFETSAQNATANPAVSAASGTLAGNSGSSIAVAAFIECITAAVDTFVPGTNYTNLANNFASSQSDHIGGNYRLNAPVGDSDTASATTASVSPGWAACIATFRSAPGIVVPRKPLPKLHTTSMHGPVIYPGNPGFRQLFAEGNSPQNLTQNLNATATYVGAQTKGVVKNVSAAALNFVGALSKATQHGLSSALITLVGAQSRNTTKNLSAASVNYNLIPFYLENSAEGGSNGTTVTTSNSGGVSGNAFDSVNIDAGASLTFDNTHAAHGGLSYNFFSSSPNDAYVVWTTSMGTQTEFWGRCYLYITAIPTNTFSFFRALNAGALAAEIRVAQSTGSLYIRDSGANIVGTSVNAVAVNAWNRIDFHFVTNTTNGRVDVALYNSNPDGTQPTELVSAVNINSGTQATAYRFGAPITAGTQTVWLDDLNLNLSGFPGPYPGVGSYPFVKNTTHGSASTVSFVGVLAKSIGKQLAAASLSLVGSLATSKFKIVNLATSIVYVGAQSRSTTHQLSAASLLDVGSIAKNAAKNLTAVLTYVGTSLGRAVVHGLSSAAVVAAGGLSRSTTKHLSSASIVEAGALAKATAKNLSGGSLTFVGAIQKATSHALSAAALTLVGAQSRGTLHTLSAAAIKYVGTQNHTVSKGLSGSIVAVGTSLQRAIGHTLSASVIPIGSSLSRAIVHGLSAASLLEVGAITKNITHGFGAAIAYVGTQARNIVHQTTAIVSYVGAQSRNITKLMYSANLLTGNLTKNTAKTLTAAALNFVGALTYSKVKIVNLSAVATYVGTSLNRNVVHGLSAASLTYVGALTRSTSKTLTAAAVKLVGAQQRNVTHNQAGAVTEVGVLNRNIGKNLSAAALLFVGALAQSKVKIVNLAATLVYSGSISRNTSHGLNAVVTYIGSVLNRNILHGSTASLKYIGTQNRVITHGFASNVVFAGAVNKAIQKTVSGILVFVGVQNRATSKSMSAASLVYLGSLKKLVSHSLVSGVIAYVGSLNKGTTHTFTAQVNNVGSFNKKTSHGLSATLTLPATLTKGIAKGLTGGVAFAGGITKQIGKSFGAALSWIGNLASTYIPHVGQLFGTVTTTISIKTYVTTTISIAVITTISVPSTANTTITTPSAPGTLIAVTSTVSTTITLG
jgi:hypothetical protein